MLVGRAEHDELDMAKTLGLVEGVEHWEWVGVCSRAEKTPAGQPGADGLRRHWFGNGRRLLWGGGPGLGDAGDETLDQLDRTLQGAAGK